MMPTLDIEEGRRLKTAADEALEMGERFSVMEGLKAVDAWDRWLDGNMDALLAAAEYAEAAERELAEAREDVARLDWIALHGAGIREARNGRRNLVCWADPDAMRAFIDAERGK